MLCRSGRCSTLWCLVLTDNLGTRPRSRRHWLRDWDPVTDSDVSVWEATHHLARRLDQQGEAVTADLLRRLGGLGDSCRELAYLLYSVCERTRRSKAAQPYNALVASWPELTLVGHSSRG